MVGGATGAHSAPLKPKRACPPEPPVADRLRGVQSRGKSIFGRLCVAAYRCREYMPPRDPARKDVKQPIALRIEAGLLAAVRRCASEENRSLTNLIETVLKARVASQPRPPAGPPACDGYAAAAPAASPPSGRTAGRGR